MRQLGLIWPLFVFILGCQSQGGNWYERSFYLLHEDHHTTDRFEVGRDADPDEVARLVGLSKPDVVQIHAKGNPGWTTYPTEIGHTPPKLARDVLGIWRDVARQDGYAFSVYYNIGRDREIMKRRPEWNRIKADGTPYDRMLCYHSGVAEGYLWPMIREIIDAYQPDGFWFDGSCFTVYVCYCDKCRERFRREHNCDVPKTPKEPGWRQYQKMQRQIYREFIRDTAAMIHEIDPDCLVAVNWAYSLRMPEQPDSGVAYLTGDIGNNVDKLSAEAHWYDSQGLPFDLMTEVCTRHGKRTAPKPPEQIQQELAVIIANGGRYFAWDNPTPESGLVPERHEFLGRDVAPFLRERQKWCLGSERLPDISLLHSAAAHYAVTDGLRAVFARNDNRIDGATDVFRRLHLNYEMIPDWRLQAQDIKSPLLIVEHPKALTEKTVDNLDKYVRNGGKLLITGMGIGLNKRIREMCGVSGYVPPRESEGLVVEEMNLAFEHWLFRVKSSTAKELIGIKEKGRQSHPLLTVNSFGRGRVFYVAIPLLSQHGKNMVPTVLVESVFRAAAPPIDRLLITDAPDWVETALRRKDGAHVVHLVNLAKGEREITKTARRAFTRITDIPPVPPCHVSVRLPTKPLQCYLQPEGIRLEGWQFKNGRLEVDIPKFKLHQMVVMHVAR